MSISTIDTAGTDVSHSDTYHELEDIRLLLSTAGPRSSWSTIQKDFKNDLDSLLRQEPSINGLEFMLRLHWVSRRQSLWRPSVVITSTSACVKLRIALYLLEGPPILRRLPDLGLDICVVQDSIGLSCDSEGTREAVLENRSLRAWAEIGTSPNGAAVVIEHNIAEETRFAIGGGMLQVGDKYIMLTALHSFILRHEDDTKHCQPADPCSGADPMHQITGAITICHEDVANGNMRLDCADDALNLLALDADKVLNQIPVPEPAYEAPRSAKKRFRQTLAYMKEGIMRVAVRLEHKTQTFLLKKTPASKSKELRQARTIDHACQTPAKLLYQGIALDWAALELDEVDPNQVSLLRQPNQIGGHVIDGIFHQQLNTAVEVTLALTNNEINGRLLDDTVFYHVDGKTLELQIVQLDAPLPRGTSGSWVTHQNKFCGMVLAVSDNIPEAYILPASALLSDVERVCGMPVRLPKVRQAWSDRDLGTVYVRKTKVYPHAHINNLDAVAKSEPRSKDKQYGTDMLSSLHPGHSEEPKPHCRQFKDDPGQRPFDWHFRRRQSKNSNVFRLTGQSGSSNSIPSVPLLIGTSFGGLISSLVLLMYESLLDLSLHLLGHAGLVSTFLCRTMTDEVAREAMKWYTLYSRPWLKGPHFLLQDNKDQYRRFLLDSIVARQSSGESPLSLLVDGLDEEAAIDGPLSRILMLVRTSSRARQLPRLADLDCKFIGSEFNKTYMSLHIPYPDFSDFPDLVASGKEKDTALLDSAFDDEARKMTTFKDPRFERVQRTGIGTYGFVDEVRENSTGNLCARCLMPVRTEDQGSVVLQNLVKNEGNIMSGRLYCDCPPILEPYF